MSSNAAHFDGNQIASSMGVIGTLGTADTQGTAQPLPFAVDPSTGAGYTNEIGTTQVVNASYKKMYDMDSGMTYLYKGIAEPASNIGSAVWQIKKTVFDANGNPTSSVYADGTPAFIKIWNNRATYTYTA